MTLAIQTQQGSGNKVTSESPLSVSSESDSKGSDSASFGQIMGEQNAVTAGGEEAPEQSLLVQNPAGMAAEAGNIGFPGGKDLPLEEGVATAAMLAAAEQWPQTGASKVMGELPVNNSLVRYTTPVTTNTDSAWSDAVARVGASLEDSPENSMPIKQTPDSSAMFSAAIQLGKTVASQTIENSSAALQVSPAGLQATATDGNGTALLKVPVSIAAPVGTSSWSQDMAGRLSTMINGNVQNATLQLNPPELGKLNIKISVDGDNASVFFSVDNSAAKDAIESAMPRLRHLMEQGGMLLTQTQVSQHAGSQSQPNAQSQAQQQGTGDNNGNGSGAVNVDGDMGDMVDESLSSRMILDASVLAGRVDYYI